MMLCAAPPFEINTSPLSANAPMNKTKSNIASKDRIVAGLIAPAQPLGAGKQSTKTKVGFPFLRPWHRPGLSKTNNTNLVVKIRCYEQSFCTGIGERRSPSE
jgi:hypothetical protein